MSEEHRWQVRRFESLDSTNRYLIDEARSGAPEGLVAVADHQTAGRGRLGRSWESPPGASLLVSVLIRPALAPRDLHLCPAAVALAAADACSTVAGVRPGIKWPNDLVVDGRKLAGVLAEVDTGSGVGTAGGVPGPAAVVVGIGLNIGWPGPPGAGGTSLLELTGRAVGRDELLEELLGSLEPRLPVLHGAPGRDGLVRELADRCVTVGQRVRVSLTGETLEGLAVGFSDAGHLLVETADGLRDVAAGDVVSLRPAAPGDPAGPGGSGSLN